MARILVFTTDLPYFPGKNGHDFFNLRYLAANHEVTVISPIYGTALPEGVRNLEHSVQNVLGWPREAKAGPLFISHEGGNCPPNWIHRLPHSWRKQWLYRLLDLDRQPEDAYERLSIQANCAPHFLQALAQGSWHAVVFIQSNLVPCLQYMPGPGARIVYFHDVRSEYLARARLIEPQKISRRDVRAIRRQEVMACQSTDLVGFVSDLDEQRAKLLLKPTGATGVAPIPIDTNYFIPAPKDWPQTETPTVLFTGHLSHPPNVDAIKYFLSEIWPLVRREVPSARFVAAGLLPADELATLSKTTPGFELHPNVPDIRPYFWNAKVYVVPMRFGGGVRQKIFEAWSMQIPVVCTTMAAEGTAARHGEICWLEDQPSDFAARLTQLLAGVRTPDVTAAAKTMVEANNSIPVAAARFQELIEKAITIRKSRPFRLLYDLRWMEIGKSGGTEQMTYELLSAMSRLDSRNEYRLYCPRSTFYEWQFPPTFRARPSFSDPNEQTWENLRAGTVNQLATGLGKAPLLTRPMRTLGALKRLDFDLVHSMVGYLHPDLAAFPHVLTALDLQHIHYPEFFSPAEWEERDRLYRESAQAARHILCISEYTRQDMHRLYGIPLSKMSTVWIIPSQRSAKPLAASLREKLLLSMGVSGPFLFFPPTAGPTKTMPVWSRHLR